jgi:predicted nucleotidyltransferase
VSTSALGFPTTRHEQVAQLAHGFFKTHPHHVDTVLVVNSCARGQAAPESDLDLAVLVTPSATVQDVQNLETRWHAFVKGEPAIIEFRQSGRFTQVHLDLFDGQFVPTEWDDGGGPDAFEVEIGNRLAYGVALGEPGLYFQQLRAHWLPYYNEELCRRRLTMVREACAYDLDRVPFFLSRRLHFSAFDYLYKAFQEFLQALFIAHRTYPLSYTKWIKEQVANRLGLPELYRELPPLLSVRDLESAEVGDKAAALRQLLERWTHS